MFSGVSLVSSRCQFVRRVSKPSVGQSALHAVRAQNQITEAVQNTVLFIESFRAERSDDADLSEHHNIHDARGRSWRNTGPASQCGLRVSY